MQLKTIKIRILAIAPTILVFWVIAQFVEKCGKKIIIFCKIAHTIFMFYYNYHGTAKRLIRDGHLVSYEILPKWNAICPAMVLFFDNHNPMPIREHCWNDYKRLIESLDD